MALAPGEIYKRCPTCHSIYKVTNPITGVDRDLTQGEIDTLKADGIYIWHRDPILTTTGLSGTDFKGKTFLNLNDIKELQEARTQQEIDADIPESQRTVFTPITADTTIVTKGHIREIRLSTEKILNALDSNLETYFNYDEDGNYIGTFEYGERKADKVEWKRVDRTYDEFPSQPCLPKTVGYIYALDIEELRCPLAINTSWYEDYTNLSPSKVQSSSDSYTFPADGISRYGTWSGWILTTTNFTTAKSNLIRGYGNYSVDMSVYGSISDYMTSSFSVGNNVNVNPTDKSIRVYLTATGSVSVRKPNPLGANPTGSVVTSENVAFTHEDSEFIDPIPHVRIGNSRRGYIKYSCNSISNKAVIGVQVWLIDKDSVLWIMDYFISKNYTTKTYSNPTTNTYYVFMPMVTGTDVELQLDFYNDIKNAGADIDNNILYYAYQVALTVSIGGNISVEAPYDILVTDSFNEYVDITLNKFGIKSV